MINRHAREIGVADKARAFSVLSHLTAMLFAQLGHAIGLNDVCCGSRPRPSRASASPRPRATTSPTPTRSATRNSPRNCSGRCWPTSSAPARASSRDAKARASCAASGSGSTRWTPPTPNWWPTAGAPACGSRAKHRRRKAAAKMHLRLDLHSFLLLARHALPVGWQ